MLGSGEQSRGDERERGCDRNEIAVNGAEDTVHPVPAESCAPVQVRLEQPAGERGRDREDQRERERANVTEPRPGLLERPALEQLALANAERGQPADRDRERRAQCDRDEREHRQGRTAGALFEHACGGARRERVRNAPCQEDDERRGEDPGEYFHRTPRVNGAVSTRPSTLHCKKSRQVPGTGSKTPTRNWPGLVALPVTRVEPRTLVQPVIPAEQTWVWK